MYTQCSAKSVNCSGILGTRIFQDQTCPISCALDVSENKWSASSLQSALDMLVSQCWGIKTRSQRYFSVAQKRFRATGVRPLEMDF